MGKLYLGVVGTVWVIRAWVTSIGSWLNSITVSLMGLSRSIVALKRFLNHEC
jgi:hypothetical protein